MTLTKDQLDLVACALFSLDVDSLEELWESLSMDIDETLEGQVRGELCNRIGRELQRIDDANAD